MQEMCGDLYPSSSERNIICETIQEMCGPPGFRLNGGGSSGHFDNWKETLPNGQYRKHKGTTVGDLEKARRDGEHWGVPLEADRSGVRPARPKRILPPVPHPKRVNPNPNRLDPPCPPGGASCTSECLDASSSPADISDGEGGGDQGGGDLQSEDKLMQQVQGLEKELAAAHAQQAAANAAKKVARQVVRDAKKDAKKGAMDVDPAPDTPAVAKVTRGKRPSNNDSGSAKKTAKVAYELARDNTVARNNNFLEFASQLTTLTMKVVSDEEVCYTVEVGTLSVVVATR